MCVYVNRLWQVCKHDQRSRKCLHLQTILSYDRSQHSYCSWFTYQVGWLILKITCCEISTWIRIAMIMCVKFIECRLVMQTQDDLVPWTLATAARPIHLVPTRCMFTSRALVSHISRWHKELHVRTWSKSYMCGLLHPTYLSRLQCRSHQRTTWSVKYESKETQTSHAHLPLRSLRASSSADPLLYYTLPT